MPQITRRGFLTTSLAALAPLPGFAASAARLTATTRVIEVLGRPATVFGLVDGQGRSGLVLDPGARFSVDLTNGAGLPTLIHWHGQIPPHAQDGVPDMPAALLSPGETRAYDFAARPGTHWMHAHIPEQEIGMMAAPLIVRRHEDLTEDRQEVVMFLQDFSFLSGAAVLEKITGGTAMDHGSHDIAKLDHSTMDMSQGMDMPMDLNDFDYDAYLVNDRTLEDPEVVQVDRGKVLLRIVNAGSGTVFWIDTGALPTRALAVDGEPVVPVAGNRWALAMGQRLDLEVTLAEAGAFPILALREGAVQRSGLILATKGAKVERLAATGEAAPAFQALDQEASFVAPKPLPAAEAIDRRMVMLEGAMAPYRWTIDGATWGEHKPIAVKTGSRVELMFHNMSMMSHPMHLHGHHFQVVALNGRKVAGARRDTVLVPPMASVTVAFDAGEPADWMLHCHHMGHLATGMMTVLRVTA